MFTARFYLHNHSRQTWKTWIVPSRFEAERRCNKSFVIGEVRRGAAFRPASATGVRQVIPTATAWTRALTRTRSMAGDSVQPQHGEIASGRALQFWENSQREAYSALYHPFVVALASGCLELSVYKKYIAQDFHFLQAFAKAYGLAIENTDDADARRILTELRSHIQDELDDVHFSATVTESKDLEVTKAEPNAATTDYTDFLLAVAKGNAIINDDVAGYGPRSRRGDEENSLSMPLAAYTIAAMTPCNRLYAFLGQEIKKSLKLSTSSHPYSEWIEMYASSDFGYTAIQSDNLIDRLSMPLSDSVSTETMRRLYRRAMDLEVAFFDAQLPLYSSSSLLVPLCHSLASNLRLVLVSDFDLTCTELDSCSALADLSLSTCEKSRLSSQTLKSRWDTLVQEYTQNSGSLMNRLLQQQGRPDYNPGMVQRISEELSEFEIAANEKVVNAGVLAGLETEDVNRAGGATILREGCKQLLEQFLDNAHILSVCWSRTFVEGALMECGLRTSNIYCNELQFNSESRSTGEILRQIQTPLDKHGKFLDILRKSREGPTNAFSVYVGDSTTDLLCLLTADIGIVIGQSKSMERVAQACGITILPLFTGLLNQQRRGKITSEKDDEKHRRGVWTKENGVLYRVLSWHELHAFLLGT